MSIRLGIDQAAALGLLVFAFSVGALALVGVLLTLLQLAAETAAALGTTGLGISISLAALKGGKR